MALGLRLDAELIVVHVVGLLDHLEANPSQPRHSHVDAIRQAFETDWCARLEGSGLEHRRLLLDGSAVPVLLATADRERADLIVLGNRRAGGASELLLGSTSLQVTAEAVVPVLVVPSPG